MTDFRVVKLGTEESELVTCENIHDAGHRISIVTQSTEGVVLLYVHRDTIILNKPHNNKMLI